MPDNPNDKTKMNPDKNQPARAPEKGNEGQVRDPSRQQGQPNKNLDVDDPNKDPRRP